MKYITIKNICLALIVCTLASCLKDKEEFIPYEEEILVNALGIVFDKDGLPVENAMVVFEGESSVTDVHGVFIFSDVAVPSKGAQIEVSLEGYFSTYRVFNPHSDNVINLNLIETNNSSTFSAQTNGNLSLGNNGSFDLPANSLVDLTGTPFGGLATVEGTYLNPAEYHIGETVPGDIIGNDNDERMLLEHYGTILLNAQDDSGLELSLEIGKTFTLSFPIPVGFSSNEDMPLWYYDKEEGIWVRNGVAIRQGDVWIATCDKLGFWSVQLGWDYTKVTGQIVNTIGQKIEGARIVIARENSTSSYRLWTDDEGKFESFVPMHERINVVVQDECDFVYARKDYGPFISQSEISRLNIDTDDRYWNVSGKIVICNTVSEGIESGYTLIKTKNSWLIKPKSNGEFTLGLFVCEDQFKVLGHDLENNKSTNNITVLDLEVKSRSWDVGVLKACN